ncbi:hypothetical protein VE00_11055 [Pseudogymnoascus sp. WSF 3629]|nr:hypothetical protein VE00_11055 [Pseudogymnoascus sp. WSF 3629]
MVFDGGYPDATFVDDPDDRRPLFTTRPVDELRDLAPELSEPISAEDLDFLHALKNDANSCLCNDDWAKNSMFESDPSSTPIFPADNSDIDNFLRELRELKEYGSKPAENQNNSAGHRSSAAHASAAPNNSNGFATSSNNMGKMPEDFRLVATLENPVLTRPVQNGANIMGPMAYSCPQPGRLTAMPDQTKEQVYTPKVLRSPTVYPKPQITATPTKANLQVHLGVPEISPADEHQTHHHKVGKSNPVSGKKATKAKTAPSISTGEFSSRPSSAHTEGVFSIDSDTTATISSMSRENSGSSDSTVPVTPKGPRSARKDPPVPGSRGPATRSKSVAVDRAAIGKNPASAITDRRNAYRERYISRSKTYPSENSDIHKACRAGGRWIGFLIRNSDTYGVEASSDGLDVHNSAPCQNEAPLPVMNGVNGSSVDNGPPASFRPPPPGRSTTKSGSMYGSTMHNGSAMQNGPAQTYGPPIQNGPLPQNSAAMQNGPMEQNIQPTYGYQSDQMHGGSVPPFIAPMQNGPVPATGAPMQNFPVPPFVAPTQNGPAPWNGAPMHNGTMLPNSAPTQNFSVPESKGIPLMRNDPMPLYATPMQNGTVPPNGYLMQNGPMPQYDGSVPQYGPPPQNGSVPQYGPPQNGSVPQYGPQNGSVPQYGPPQNGSVPQYGHPMQNGNMPPNNARMLNGHMPAYGAPIENGMMPVYDPPMQNPLNPMNGGHFVNASNAYISITGNGFQGYVSNGQGNSGQGLNAQALSVTAPPNMQNPSGQGASG